MSDALVAVKSPRLEPRAIPEMVLFCSWLLPIDDEATTWPLAFTERRELVRPVKAKLVVVAEVVVAFVARKVPAPATWSCACGLMVPIPIRP